MKNIVVLIGSGQIGQAIAETADRDILSVGGVTSAYGHGDLAPQKP